MSDKQKGLINAVAKVWPDAEHRFCVRHLLQNFQKAGHKGETLKAIARSSSVVKWEKNMEKLKSDKLEAYEWVEKLVPSTWIKAFFQEFPKCDMLLNNHSEVFNSYINEARELPFLSMQESIFYKILQRVHGKEKDGMKWSGRICPKIKKKLDKFTEWSTQCRVIPAGNKIFHVSSLELEQGYSVDFNTKTCDCKRWQLTGIPCHHAIACCRNDRINPESLVHSCYTIDTYLKAYQYKLAPLRGRPFWEKMNGVVIHPPLFTKVMGRPKKNRKKAPEEKMKKGIKILTKSGVTMHCSICGKPDHNKKGHDKFVERQLKEQRELILQEDDDLELPHILEHVIPHKPNPTMDPTNQRESMVYSLGQEEQNLVPISRVLGPLPENSFVADARDSIPENRVRITTASSRGSLRGRSRVRRTANREASKGKAPVEQQQSSSRCRGRGNGKKRSSDATTAASAQGYDIARAAKRGYKIGPGSAHYLLFGDDQPRGDIPDLNAEVLPDINMDEFSISQNAPAVDDF